MKWSNDRGGSCRRMRRFRYCMNHKADEAYMAEMCRRGWAAVSLVEGVWTFAPCRPGQYTFRVGYLRGRSRAEVEQWKASLTAQGIEFVSRYSFWAIFRSEHEFALYSPEEELALCEAIRRPMLPGSVLSWIAFFVFLRLAGGVSRWFCLPAVLLGIYAAMCTCLGISYARLIHRLSGARL